MNLQQAHSEGRPRYVWPWFVLGAVLLGIALAILWVSKEAARTRSLREWNTPTAPTQTNSAPVEKR